MNNHRQKVVEIITKNSKVNFNPGEKELLALVENYRIKNKDNLIMFKTNITSRSKSFTKYVNDENYEKYDYTLSNIIDTLQKEELIVVTIKIGMNENIQLKGTTILSKEPNIKRKITGSSSDQIKFIFSILTSIIIFFIIYLNFPELSYENKLPGSLIIKTRPFTVKFIILYKTLLHNITILI